MIRVFYRFMGDPTKRVDEHKHLMMTSVPSSGDYVGLDNMNAYEVRTVLWRESGAGFVPVMILNQEPL
jgi:hypothetical protein